jgi:glycerol 3-phosphatase-2
VLHSSPAELCSAYDLAMLDLDGVVYIGGEAVPGAAEALAAARDRGMHLAFVTNNAARPPGDVAGHLTSLGVAAAEADVVTSAQAAARLAAEAVPGGARVLALGGPGVAQALTEAGLVPVDDIAHEPVAVVTGYGPELTWQQLLRGAILIKQGLPWIACNTDLTIPTDVGVGPGHGALVELFARFSGRDPVVAGKPLRPLLDETVRRVGGARPLMVGDRLDTDVEGAVNAGVDSLLVLTGVTGLEELVAAPPRHRPTYLASDLAGLLTPHPAPRDAVSGCSLAGWTGQIHGGHVAVAGSGRLDDWWRVVATAAWQHLDATGRVALVSGLEPGVASRGGA